MSTGRSMRQRGNVSYKDDDMNQAKTPGWLKKTSADAPAPKPRRTEGFNPNMLAAKLLQHLEQEGGGGGKAKAKAKGDAVKKPAEGQPSRPGARKEAGKENAAAAAAADRPRWKPSTTAAVPKTPATNGPTAPANTARKGSAATGGNAAKAKVTSTSGAKQKAAGAGAGGAGGAKPTVSRKVVAMARAAAIATDGLKRPAHHFSVDEDPSDHGSTHRHEGGRPAKRQARVELHSRFEAAATPAAAAAAARSPPGASPSPSPSPLPVLALPAPAAQHRSKKSSKKAPAHAPAPAAAAAAPAPAAAAPAAAGRYAQFAEAAAAAAAAAAAGSRHTLGSQGEKLPAGVRPDGAWSSAYRTLQAAHLKLQTKYDKLKDTKLAGLIDEADVYRAELAEHGAKAEELINHFRGEVVRHREAAAGAEGAGLRVYDVERENAELKETLLAYQGKILRMEQGAAKQHQQRLERAAAEASAGASGRGGGEGEAGGGGGAGTKDAWGTDKLEAFMGLSWAKQATGIHHFRHAATGFKFQMSAADPTSYDDDGDEDGAIQLQRGGGSGGGGGGGSGGGGETRSGSEPADEVSFTPLEFGDAEGYLPGYLSEAIEFARGEMPEFVARMLGVLNQVAHQVAAENDARH